MSRPGAAFRPLARAVVDILVESLSATELGEAGRDPRPVHNHKIGRPWPGSGPEPKALGRTVTVTVPACALESC